jgi:hypothetical protein
MLNGITEDMRLLENQLPFFVIKEIFNFAFPSYSNFPSFAHLTFEFFTEHNIQKMSPNPKLEIMHFLDLLRTFFLPQSRSLPQRQRQ